MLDHPPFLHTRQDSDTADTSDTNDTKDTNVTNFIGNPPISCWQDLEIVALYNVTEELLP
jgi:hypothetical protein